MKNSFLIFELKKELFAIDVNNITEVIDYTPVTSIPETPEYIKGIINYRGNILPIIDLRTKFNLEQKSDYNSMVIIVMSIDIKGKTVVLGGIADSVSNVFEINIMTTTKLPEIGTKFNTEYILGITENKDDKIIVLLDIEKIFTVDEITIINEAGT